VENPEEPIDADVDARRLEQRLVLGIDLDSALGEQARNRLIRQNHRSILGGAACG
jgi:hypothetical protein